MKRHPLAPLLSALALCALLGAAPAPSVLPDSQSGRRAAAYFEAFNRGREEAMRAFIQANVSPEALAQRPVADRLRIYREMRDEHRTLAATRLVRRGDAELEVIARNARGEALSLTFLFEPAPPHRLLGLRVMDTGDDGAEGGPDAAATPMSDDQAVAAWSAHLDSLTGTDRFSGAALVAKDGRVLFESAYGRARRGERDTPNRVDTKFNLGSINKIFTALAIARLAEQGKLELDHTIDRYLPDYPEAVASKVTIRHLLDHRGGVGDIFGPTYDRADRSKLRAVADWIPMFRDQPLAFEPGTKQQYSNGGYVLLGAIVEKVSGEDYYDHVREHIYEPLGMEHTGHFADDDGVPNLATGYTRRGAPEDADWQDNRGSRPMRGSPAGGGYSTLGDLLKFTRALRAGELVQTATLRDFPQLGPGPGGSVGLGIGGGAPGINAAVELNGPYTIIVLSNFDPPAAGSAARTLRRWLPVSELGGRRVSHGREASKPNP